MSKYLIYNFTGLTCSDGTTKAISLYDVILKHPKMFLTLVDEKFETVNTLKLYEDNLFCLDADYYEMESIQHAIEDGFVIIPFSRTFFIMDLIPYYKMGMKVLFMKIKDYKQFKSDYEDSQLVAVEDKRTKGLF